MGSYLLGKPIPLLFSTIFPICNAFIALTFIQASGAIWLFIGVIIYIADVELRNWILAITWSYTASSLGQSLLFAILALSIILLVSTIICLTIFKADFQRYHDLDFSLSSLQQ